MCTHMTPATQSTLPVASNGSELLLNLLQDSRHHQAAQPRRHLLLCSPPAGPHTETQAQVDTQDPMTHTTPTLTQVPHGQAHPSSSHIPGMKSESTTPTMGREDHGCLLTGLNNLRTCTCHVHASHKLTAHHHIVPPTHAAEQHSTRATYSQGSVASCCKSSIPVLLQQHSRYPMLPPRATNQRCPALIAAQPVRPPAHSRP